MGFISEIFGIPLGWVMWLCHKIVNNYGIALFLFTLLARAAMLPLTFKQQKSSAKMALIQPQMQELQKKYANNRDKLNEEMTKLYQKEKYNPASGCLPMLIQFPVLFGVIDVIYKPLQHILHIPKDVIASITAITQAADASIKSNFVQVGAIELVKSSTHLFSDINQEYIRMITDLDMNFFGLNLGQPPTWDMIKNIFQDGFNPLLLIPLLSGLSALAMSLISMRSSAANTEGAAGMGAMKSMFLIMPIFSFTIPFGMPAGVGLYWTYSNIVGIGQSLLMNRFYNPKKLAEQAKQEKEEREERERQERIEAKKLAKEQQKLARERGEEVVDEKALSQKELNRRKLAEARRRDAERYGEEYVEVTDDDIR